MGINSNQLDKSQYYNIKIIQLVIGILILTIGLLLYLIDRQPETVFFINAFGLTSFYNPDNSRIFGGYHNNLPSFLHTCSLSLIHVAFISSNNRLKLLSICISWVFVNIMFEVGQLITPPLLINTPISFYKYTFMSPIIDYFKYGVFDYFDVLFSIFGGLTAYFIILTTYKKRTLNNELSTKI